MEHPTPKPELFKFAYFLTYNASIEHLAINLADKEEWDFSDVRKKNYSILKNYLEFTFRRLIQESKIKFTSNNEYASFNTGLVTNNLEEIFALFQDYKSPGKGNSPWFFKSFVKKVTAYS